MATVRYVSRARIERLGGPGYPAYPPAEDEPVIVGARFAAGDWPAPSPAR